MRNGPAGLETRMRATYFNYCLWFLWLIKCVLSAHEALSGNCRYRHLTEMCCFCSLGEYHSFYITCSIHKRACIHIRFWWTYIWNGLSAVLILYDDHLITRNSLHDCRLLHFVTIMGAMFIACVTLLVNAIFGSFTGLDDFTLLRYRFGLTWLHSIYSNSSNPL